MTRLIFGLRQLVVWLLVLSSLRATASGYTSIYVFGDGVSTTTQNPAPQPSGLYNGSRYCDGSVWVEVLSQARGVTYAPAKNISYYGHYSSLMVNSVNDLASPADAATSLFIIWCANADFVKFVSEDAIPPNNANLSTWQNAITASVNNHVIAVNALYQYKNARFVMLPTAVDIMKVPLFNNYDSTDKAFIRARIVDFNTQLATAMNNLAATKPELTIVRPDVFGFLDQVLANPSADGMVNPFPYNSAIDELADPWTQGRNFIFWDFQHPTAKFQAALANFINNQVPVLDTTPPGLSLPNPAPIVEATGPGGAVVTFTSSANDALDGSRPTTANPPSGSTFPLGNTTVTVTASDTAGNTATGNFVVTVRDTTAPTLPSLTNFTREATSPSGAVVTFTLGSATDLVSGSRTCAANPPSGSTFPLGNTTVTVTASDTAGNTATGNFVVTVRDTTAPTLPSLTNFTREATSPSGAVVTFTLGSATDLVSGSRSCMANPPSGSMFPIGTSTVQVGASDAAGNAASGSFKVTVVNMKTLLQNVSITPGVKNPAAITGLIQGGPPGGQVMLQASTDMGMSDPWQDISTITLDSNGNQSFGPISDPQGSGLSRDFFRIKLLLSP